MDDKATNIKSSAGETTEEVLEKTGTNHTTLADSTVVPSPSVILSQLLPFQYSPDLAYSTYLLGYNGSLMGAPMSYLPPSALPPFGALPVPNVLQRDLMQRTTDINNKPTESPGTPKHGPKRPYEPNMEVEKFLNVGDNPLPMTVISKNHDLTLQDASSEKIEPSKKSASTLDTAQAEKLKMNRDRNREHARSTRLRKKAYVSKLKELVDGLHVERSEDARKRRIAVQHVAEAQRVRRSVIISFLNFLANNQSDDRKLMTILEENFVLKQPITPFRWFRAKEIDGESRKTTGIEGIKEEAASISVMIDNIGSRCARWKQIKREEFLTREELKARRNRSRFPHNFVRQNSCLQHAMSSLSSSGSYKTNESSKSDEQQIVDLSTQHTSSSGSPTHSVNSSETRNLDNKEQGQELLYFHDYDAKPLPDPKLESSTYDTSDSGTASQPIIVGKHVCTDSSSGEEDKLVISKNCKQQQRSPQRVLNGTLGDTSITNDEGQAKQSFSSKYFSSNLLGKTVSNPSTTDSSEVRMKNAPAIKLPPFGGIGKKKVATAQQTCEVDSDKGVSQNMNSIIGSMKFHSSNPDTTKKCTAKKNSDRNESNMIGDHESSSSFSSISHIQAYYHVNEDDMIITGDVLMCSFIFRSQDAVLCGALADCVMPGMLRAQFSSRNKLAHIEMAYDAMGFMQQVERASGNDGFAQVIPNSLEMTLQPTNVDARIITMAKPPYLVVSVNEAWTAMTSFTQLDVEGKECSIFHSKRFDHDFCTKKGVKPVHHLAEVTKGFPSCSINMYRDKHYKDIVVHVSSYPLTNSRDEITYILHVWNLLPELDPFRHLV